MRLGESNALIAKSPRLIVTWVRENFSEFSVAFNFEFYSSTLVLVRTDEIKHREDGRIASTCTDM